MGASANLRMAQGYAAHASPRRRTDPVLAVGLGALWLLPNTATAPVPGDRRNERTRHGFPLERHDDARRPILCARWVARFTARDQRSDPEQRQNHVDAHARLEATRVPPVTIPFRSTQFTPRPPIALPSRNTVAIARRPRVRPPRDLSAATFQLSRPPRRARVTLGYPIFSLLKTGYPRGIVAAGWGAASAIFWHARC